MEKVTQRCHWFFSFFDPFDFCGVEGPNRVAGTYRQLTNEAIQLVDPDGITVVRDLKRLENGKGNP